MKTIFGQIRSMLRMIPFLFLFHAFHPSQSFGQGFQNVNIDFLRRNVVFIQVPCEQISPVPPNCIPHTLVPWGTGFLVTLPYKPGGEYVILVTARHMVDPSFTGCGNKGPTEIHAFFNKAVFDPNEDTTGVLDETLSTETASWKFPDDDSADVAVIQLNGPLLASLKTENLGVSIRDLPTEQETKQVITGDEIISAGLLVGASGSKRNYPIFKFGYVSSRPDEKISLPCCPGCAATKYLTQWMIAASLVPGNSGSPIYFVPPFMLVGSPTNRRVLLLGVQSTSFIGSDVAGMTPVKFLVEAIRELHLVDADLSITGEPWKPDAPKPK